MKNKNNIIDNIFESSSTVILNSKNLSDSIITCIALISKAIKKRKKNTTGSHIKMNMGRTKKIIFEAIIKVPLFRIKKILGLK